MTLYRIYTIDRSNHVSGPAMEVDCLSDEEAIEQAKQMLDGHVIEVWEQARVVRRLEPEKKDLNPQRNG